METTYSELMTQAQNLMNQANEIRKKETAADILVVKEIIKKYNLTAEDCGFTGSVRKTPKAHTYGKVKAAPKFRGPGENEEWSGGPGRKPAWVSKIIEEGKANGDENAIEKYRIL